MNYLTKNKVLKIRFQRTFKINFQLMRQCYDKNLNTITFSTISKTIWTEENF